MPIVLQRKYQYACRLSFSSTATIAVDIDNNKKFLIYSCKYVVHVSNNMWENTSMVKMDDKFINPPGTMILL